MDRQINTGLTIEQIISDNLYNQVFEYLNDYFSVDTKKEESFDLNEYVFFLYQPF